MTVSIRLTLGERNLAESDTDAEDKFDVAVANKAYNEYINSGKKSRPVSELWRELKLL